MGKNVAVVAHFDADNRVDDNFLRVIACLVSVMDVVILVSTSDIPVSEVAHFDKVVLIKRPNIGYDFYSYRVGLAYARDHFEVDCVLFTNSSYFLTDSSMYSAMLRALLKKTSEYDAVSLTESLQFGRHLQSYMMVVRSRLIEQPWVTSFFNKVEPTNTKFEVILNYEIGFSKALAEHGIPFHSLYQPDVSVKYRSLSKWLRVIWLNTRLLSWFKPSRLADVRSINWTHFAAVDIAKQFGLVKSEVMRTNPHGIPTEQVIANAEAEVRESISDSIQRSQKYYAVSGNGLSTFSVADSPLPSYRAVSYGVSKVEGVRVAVVIHLFYYDLLEEILTYLRHIIEPFDLYVTTPHEGDVSKIINDSAALASSVNVYVTENRGRDIGPFLSLYLSGCLDTYNAVLKLHSKKSKYSSLGSEWRKSLYGALMGDSLVVRKVLALFNTQHVGVIGPHHYYLSNDNFWGANRDAYARLLVSSGSAEADALPPLGFFAGSMFWFAPSALASLKNIPMAELNFPSENGMQDGTLAHAFERIFCPVARAQGYLTTSVILAGAEIDGTDTQGNKVPVL